MKNSGYRCARAGGWLSGGILANRTRENSRILAYAIGSLCLAGSATASMQPAAPATQQHAPAAPAAADSSRRIELANGVRVILVPVPGVKHVAVETIYEVGFLHEPEGLAQSSHLLEHVLCKGATASWAAGESFELLAAGGTRGAGEAMSRGKGLANAETLADFTHFDAVVPAGEKAEGLELVLRVEAERLTSLRIEPAIVAQEGPRAASEVDAVSNAPQAPVFKFAVMAANQVWRFRSEEVRIARGLEDMDVAGLRALFAEHYVPKKLTVVIVGAMGDGGVAGAEALVRKHLGAIQVAAPAEAAEAAAKRAPIEAIEWDALPASADATWDCPVNAAVVSWGLPQGLIPAGAGVDQADKAGEADNAALGAAMSFWMEATYAKLAADADLLKVARSTFVSNSMWPVGLGDARSAARLPVLASISIKDGIDADAAAAVLVGRMEAHLRAGPTEAELAMIAGGADGFAMPPGELVAMFQRQLAMMGDGAAARLGANPEQMVLGNAALQIGMRTRLTGPDGAAWAKRVKAATKRLGETGKLMAGKAKVVMLKPAGR